MPKDTSTAEHNETDELPDDEAPLVDPEDWEVIGEGCYRRKRHLDTE